MFPVVAVFIVAVAVAAYAALAVRIYLRQRGPRVVHCPATGQAVSVHLPAARAAVGLHRRGVLEVTHCTLWPERSNCAQGCLAEIERSPDRCLFQERLALWYRGRQCAFCGRAIPEVRWGDLKPSLLAPDGRILMWSEIPPPTIYEVLETHRPVCASCDISETFRQRHADWVVERPPRAPAEPPAPLPH